MTLRRRPGRKASMKPEHRDGSNARAGSLPVDSFACTCGAEIELSTHAALTADIVCVGCGEWIGIYAELMLKRAARVAHVNYSSPGRSWGRDRRSRGRGRSRC